ncbi:MAG: sulfide/dihydroorotate dehydrogenase-like FAD/NAD-binding protein [Clostridia bacterium]|nr:sulfide/dihydroorotate dehydrogenase-like FAD/NAD-binding protein [Clostridia bacterium]
MEQKKCFAAVDFADDENVSGYLYWYLCRFANVEEGDLVVAPLGRHNNLQQGVVRQVLFACEDDAPFPVQYVKHIRNLVKTDAESLYRIVKKCELNSTVTMMDIYAPLVAKKAEAGQFIILRVDDDGERIPLTVAGYDRKAGTVKIIFQVVGATTIRLNTKREGEYIADFVGPLGCATKTEGLKKVCVVGGGVGCAIALPVAQKLHALGCEVHSVIGFRSKDLLILEDEFKACSDKLTIVTDDGSYGRKGVVTVPLKEAIESGEKYDEVIAIGPLVMMKFVVATTKPYGIPTTVSMNPIMIDGTGMCGGCRLTVGGKTKFACVDGPDFDGFEVDFDEAMARSDMYAQFEQKERENCNLFKKEVR